MTQPAQPQSEATASIPAAQDRLGSAVASVVIAIERELSPGDLSQLRRLSPADPGAPAFWRLMVSRLEPAGVIPAGGAPRDEAERDWAVAITGMAWMQGLHAKGQRPGTALAAAGFSELRFVRLLRARGSALHDAVITAARFLASKGERVDWTQLVRLLRTPDGEDAERLRRNIARDYYRAASQPADAHA